MPSDPTALEALPVIRNRWPHSRAYRRHAESVAAIIAEVTSAYVSDVEGSCEADIEKILATALKAYLHVMGIKAT